MSAEEQVVWWKVLAIIWGFSLFLSLLLGVAGTPEGKAVGPQVAAWFAGGNTVAYLLILSWRAAYLSGRSNR